MINDIFVKVLLFSILFFTLMLMPKFANCLTDSTISNISKRTFSLRGIANAAFTSGSTQLEDSKNSFSFENLIDCNYYISNSKFRKQLTFKSSLGFLRYADSIWVKTADSWRVTARYIQNQPQKINYSYSIIINSQYLDTYKYKFSQGELKHEWKSNFFNPGYIILSYGLTKSFWEYCLITFSFANVKIYTKPRSVQLTKDQENFALTKYSKIYSEYGLSISTFIEKYINENIFFENTLLFFSNGINREKVELTCSNGLSIRLYKFINIRVANNISYNPFNSYRVLYETRVCLGFILDYKNGKFNQYDLKMLLTK